MGELCTKFFISSGSASRRRLGLAWKGKIVELELDRAYVRSSEAVDFDHGLNVLIGSTKKVCKFHEGWLSPKRVQFLAGTIQQKKNGTKSSNPLDNKGRSWRNEYATVENPDIRVQSP